MKWAVFDKYIGYVQDLIASPGVLDCINSLAANEPTAKFVRGFLKLHLNGKVCCTFDSLCDSLCDT